MSKLFSIFPEHLDEQKLMQAANIMKEGGIVIYPTDTIYAMGCSILQPKAIERMAKIKGIRVDKAVFSLIVHDLGHITEYTRPMNNSVYKLMKRCLPGPFTFILEANSNIIRMMSSRRKTVGIRIPGNPVILGLAEKLGCPIVSTSLHDEDEITKFPTDPDEIFDHYQDRVDAVINGGYGNNEESTIIDCTGQEPVIIRQGLGIIN
jgi:tRNA threonylcarbamoyl adenosine modification protein (Sua5/YciO/YrdC/YwlC family)